jgi:hypothetical protein
MIAVETWEKPRRQSAARVGGKFGFQRRLKSSQNLLSTFSRVHRQPKNLF